MSKAVKSMMVEMYRQRFADVENAVVVDIRGIDANDNNEFRNDLAKKTIHVTVLKNRLVKHAFEGAGLEGLNEVIEGPSALVYGGDSVIEVVRELVDWAKKLRELDIKGAILDGEVFVASDIERLSKYPTREEAKAQVVQLIISPAQKIVGAAKSPASNIAGILKTIEEKLENGESITKVA